MHTQSLISIGLSCAHSSFSLHSNPTLRFSSQPFFPSSKWIFSHCFMRRSPTRLPIKHFSIASRNTCWIRWSIILVISLRFQPTDHIDTSCIQIKTLFLEGTYPTHRVTDLIHPIQFVHLLLKSRHVAHRFLWASIYQSGKSDASQWRGRSNSKSGTLLVRALPLRHWHSIMVSWGQ